MNIPICNKCGFRHSADTCPAAAEAPAVPDAETIRIINQLLMHRYCHPVIARALRELRDSLAAPKADKTLRHAGAMLSNCAFNLSQRKPGEPLTEADIRALDKSRKAWDEAIHRD